MEQYVLPGMASYFLPEWAHENHQAMRGRLETARAFIDGSAQYLREAERLLAGGPTYEQLELDFRAPVPKELLVLALAAALGREDLLERAREEPDDLGLKVALDGLGIDGGDDN